jgi:hypothetical protein
MRIVGDLGVKLRFSILAERLIPVSQELGLLGAGIVGDNRSGAYGMGLYAEVATHATSCFLQGL